MAIDTNIHNDWFTRGDSFIHRITVLNTDGTPHDITGATAVYTVRSPDYDNTVIVQKTGGAGIQLTVPEIGVMDVTLDPADTVLFVPARRYTYDAQLTIAGQVCTVQTGVLSIKGDVTHP